MIAWVEVPGTSIDEPIVQAAADAPNAYLYEDALGRALMARHTSIVSVQ